MREVRERQSEKVTWRLTPEEWVGICQGKNEWKIPVKDAEAKKESLTYLETNENKGDWEIVSNGWVAENKVEDY